MDHSNHPQIEPFAPLGELVNTMLMAQNGLFETFEATLKEFEQNLNQLKDSLDTLCEKLLLLEEIIQPEEKKFPL